MKTVTSFYILCFILFVFKFLAALGLHCGEQAFSSNGTWASLIVAHKLSYPVTAVGTWALLRSGIS